MTGYAVLATIFLFLSVALAILAAVLPGAPDPHPARFRLFCFSFAAFVAAEIVFRLLVVR
jgi:hypothetical protein